VRGGSGLGSGRKEIRVAVNCDWLVDSYMKKMRQWFQTIGEQPDGQAPRSCCPTSRIEGWGLHHHVEAARHSSTPSRRGRLAPPPYHFIFSKRKRPRRSARVFSRLQKYGWSKTQLVQNKLSFLGHEITSQRIAFLPEKVQAIKD